LASGLLNGSPVKLTVRHTLAAAAILIAQSAAAAPNARQQQTSKLDRALRESAALGGTQRAILTLDPACTNQDVANTVAATGRVRRSHPLIHALVVELRSDDLARFVQNRCVLAASADATVSVDAVPAPYKREKFQDIVSSRRNRYTGQTSTLRDTLGLPHTAGRDGVSGRGVGVAIIDSGIAPSDDFGTRITAFYDFTRGGVATAPFDEYGHGTHVAGLIGSSGRLSGGEFQGIAPDVHFVGLKVLDRQGSGSTSDVISALEFVTANRDALGVQIVNMSLGHDIYAPAKYDPLVQAVEKASASGLIVVVAAGNAGRLQKNLPSGYTGITSPGNAPSAITVGAVVTNNTTTRGDDTVAPYSSRGPTWFDAFAKPDVVAPGDRLLSDDAQNSYLDELLPAKKIKVNFRQTLLELSGTSMAAAVTSGVVALVVEQHEALRPRRPISANLAKAMLQFSALPIANADRLTQGTGQINAAGAVALAAAIDTSVRPKQWWLRTGVTPSSTIGGHTYGWSQNIIWGDNVLGGDLLYVSSAAFTDNIVWGTADDNIVWGTAAFAVDDNIVWGTSAVWGPHLVWKDRIIGEISAGNIIWGTLKGTAIVWGTLTEDNIVWGTADGDNIVWGTWEGDNIIWGTSDDDNIVWGTSDDNIVWGTSEDNIVWGTGVLGGEGE
jgi:serine protease AprX